ncbi:MAG: hypothetical protein IJ730_02950 [Alphaproteobacteria bacterium]|nr:hypothetical protein [Alphaproteobacteria bacterium]
MGNVLSCFFPTTVVLVDDDPTFLNFLKLSLEGMPIVCKAFSDAQVALDFINASSVDNSLDYTNLIRSGEEGTSEWKSILLNIGGLHTEIYSSNRFNKISLVISDYQMPNMNGVEFCSKILGKGIQKILLTGLADDKIAIDAFNLGYISQFFRKNLSFDIKNAVNRTINKYFKIYTDYILQHASLGELYHLNDPIFSDFFNKIFKQDDFVEYYMLDSFGSYLMLKSNGQKRILNVLTEIEFSRLLDVAIESEEADTETIQKLQSRKFMLVYHNRNGSLPPVSEWYRFLKPAYVIDGSQTYYYNVSDERDINNYSKPDLDENEIVTFDSFKKIKNYSSKDF